MKSILISIKPKYVAKILNGEKTIEIRKTMPKCDLPIDVYIYCTKDKKQGIVWDSEGKSLVFANKFPYDKGSPEHHRLVNGKVVAKFTLNKVEEIKKTERHDAELLDKSCLTATEFYDYLLNKFTFNETIGYAWHIDDLVIFDKPRELRDFDKVGSKEAHEKALKYAEKEDWKIRERIINDIALESECANCTELEEYAYYLGAYGLTRAPQSWCYVEIDQ